MPMTAVGRSYKILIPEVSANPDGYCLFTGVQVDKPRNHTFRKNIVYRILKLSDTDHPPKHPQPLILADGVLFDLRVFHRTTSFSSSTEYLRKLNANREDSLNALFGIDKIVGILF